MQYALQCLYCYPFFLIISYFACNSAYDIFNPHCDSCIFQLYDFITPYNAFIAALDHCFPKCTKILSLVLTFWTDVPDPFDTIFNVCTAAPDRFITHRNVCTVAPDHCKKTMGIRK